MKLDRPSPGRGLRHAQARAVAAVLLLGAFTPASPQAARAVVSSNFQMKK